MTAWKPISEDDLQALIEDAIKRMLPDIASRFSGLKTPLRRIALRGHEKFFIVAQLGDKALYYDDIEEEFATAFLEGEEMTDGNLFGELEWALADLLKD